MYKLKEIADKVYYVGVNDRQKAHSYIRFNLISYISICI